MELSLVIIILLSTDYWGMNHRTEMCNHPIHVQKVFVLLILDLTYFVRIIFFFYGQYFVSWVSLLNKLTKYLIWTWHVHSLYTHNTNKYNEFHNYVINNLGRITNYNVANTLMIKIWNALHSYTHLSYGLVPKMWATLLTHQVALSWVAYLAM